MKKIFLNGGFFIYAFLLEAIYLSFFLVEPIRKRLGDKAITLLDYRIFFVLVFLLLAALMIYCLAFHGADEQDVKKIFIFSVVFNLTLLFVWPIGSTDIFTYAYQSRILSHHGDNPYLHTYSQYPHDPLFSSIANQWIEMPYLYGPVFLIIMTVITFLGGNSLLLTLFFSKTFFVLINILNGWLVYKITKSKKALFLYAWNPYVLYEFSVNGHNDVLIIFFILLCLYYSLAKAENLKNYLIGLSFLTLSALIKIISIILLPIFLFVFLLLKKAEERMKLIMLTIILSVVLFGVFYLPFWPGLSSFTRFVTYSNLNNTMAFASPVVIMLIMLIYKVAGTMNFKMAMAGGKLLFALSYLLVLLDIWRKKALLTKVLLVKYFFLVLTFFYLTFFNMLRPWYFISLITLIICYTGLKDERKYEWMVYSISTVGILYYLILR